MILSDKHKFIFVHIPKTGGMSVKLGLKKVSYKENYVPRKYLKEKQAIKKHDKAVQIKNYMKPKIWAAYYKFAFVRNPFDWMVSLYYYIRKDKKDPRYGLAKRINFKQFVYWFNAANPKKYPARNGQKQYITGRDGVILVDFIGRFEQFDIDLRKICSRFGIHIKIPHVNITKHTHYTTYYDFDTRKYIQSMFKEDLSFFRYSF